MSNSKLISYTQLSPSCNKPRNCKIDTVTIHCMAGNMSVEACGNLFANKALQTSSNYGIGSDGRIALYVDEANRSWCSSNAENDHRAVTIEVANTEAKEPWPVSEKALGALIALCADICERNGIKNLLWRGDKSLVGQTGKQNMTVHRWFAAKACPGDYLYNKHAYIADEVNRRLGAAAAKDGMPTAAAKPPYQARCIGPKVNIRVRPDISSADVGDINGREIYTIIEESKGPGAKLWGKLKSGAGWVSLDYFERV